MRTDAGAVAIIAGRYLTDLVEVTSDLSALDREGIWVVVLPFEGARSGPDLAGFGPPVGCRRAGGRGRPWGCGCRHSTVTGSATASR